MATKGKGGALLVIGGLVVGGWYLRHKLKTWAEGLIPVGAGADLLSGLPPIHATLSPGGQFSDATTTNPVMPETIPVPVTTTKPPLGTHGGLQSGLTAAFNNIVNTVKPPPISPNTVTQDVVSSGPSLPIDSLAAKPPSAASSFTGQKTWLKTSAISRKGTFAPKPSAPVKLPTTAIASERELLGLIELGKRDASMVRSQIRELQYVEKAFAEAKKVARVSSTSTQRQLVMRLQGKRDSAKRDVTRGVILLEGRAAGIKKAKNELVAYKNSISKTTNSRQVASLTATIKAASMMFATLVTIAKIARTVITSSNSAGVRYPQVAPTPTNPVNTAAKLANTFAVRR